MSLEMWAVILSFTGMVALFGYITNEIVKWIERVRARRKALKRVSTARNRMAA